MSYIFDGVNDRLTGTFTTGRVLPITLACWFKVADHPLANDWMLTLSVSSSSTTNYTRIGTNATDNQWRVEVVDNASTLASANVTQTVDGIWTPMVAVIQADGTSDLYVTTFAGHGGPGNPNTITGNLTLIWLGENPSGGGDYVGRLAEAAIWDSALTTQQITDYLSGISASVIAAANLIGYWPMSSADITNLGLDAGGDLTAVNQAAFDADHPTITIPSVTAPSLYVVRSGIRLN